MAPRFLAATVGAVLIGGAATGADARTQAQLTPTFKERLPAGASPAAPAGCVIAVPAITDERRSPELAGVVGQRAVLAPQDFDGWMRAVFAALPRRGIDPRFGADAAASGPSARFALQTAWIATTASSYSANVVVRLTATGTGGAAIDQIYRGRVLRTSFWSGGVDTLQSAIDGAFADALDAMAPDLRALCGAAKAT